MAESYKMNQLINISNFYQTEQGSKLAAKI